CLSPKFTNLDERAAPYMECAARNRQIGPENSLNRNQRLPAMKFGRRTELKIVTGTGRHVPALAWLPCKCCTAQFHQITYIRNREETTRSHGPWVSGQSFSPDRARRKKQSIARRWRCFIR